MKKRVGVVFGGRSGEHEISIRSARSVVEQIDSDKYELVPLAITNDGAWLSPAESLVLLAAETQEIFLSKFGEPSSLAVALLADASVGGLMAADGSVISLDVVFPVLHGTYGEDGTIQGMLEMAEL
ncbi:MAG: D-alanine--D-alanine ligase A, partial [Pyrinomonadaceae bacterium]